MKLTIDFLKQIGFIFGIPYIAGSTEPRVMHNGVLEICVDHNPFQVTNIKSRSSHMCDTIEALTQFTGWDAQIKNGIDWRKDESLKLEKENAELKKLLLSCVEIYRQYANDDPRK